MYSPKSFTIEHLEEKQEFIKQFSFGVLVSSDLEATHLPFILKEGGNGQLGELYCHFARANPHWKHLDQQEVLVIFSGPHAYISPTWYDKAPAVPTWNYAAVHVKGKLSVLAESELPELLNTTLATYEPGLLENRAHVTQGFQDKLTPAIVGCKIEITHIQGKRKLGQNRSQEDQSKVYKRLGKAAISHNSTKEGSTFVELDALQLHNFMQQCNIGTGGSED